MAAVLMMAGGSMGFFLAVIGLIAFDFGILHALATWVGIGAGFCILGLVCAALPAKACETPTAARRA